MKELVFYPKAEDSGLRIDVYLSRELNETRSRIKSLADGGKVFYDGKAVSKSGFIIKDKPVTVHFEEAVVLDALPEDIPLDIVYQDSELAVINKTQGMVTHPAMGSPTGTLVNAILFHIKDLSGINGVLRPGIVHRLDKNTSGLLVVAKTNAAHLSLAAQIAEKSAERIYTGLVTGNIKEEEGVVDAAIERSKKDRMIMTVSPTGKRAVTHYRVLERFIDYTLVEFKLETGRTHQIRAHMKYKNHVIAGDTEYGARDNFKLAGQLLHSCRLSFDHPITGERMTFSAPIPDYFEEVLRKLRMR